MAKGMIEHNMQVACVRWFRLQYRTFAKNLFAIPNGGWRNVITGRMLKEEGVLAGVPDLFLAVQKGNFAGFFIELKTSKGVLSDRQEEMQDILWRAGYYCRVVRSFEDFKEQIIKYMSYE